MLGLQHTLVGSPETVITDMQVVIADDHDILRSGVRALFESHPQWTVCGEASDGEQAVALAASLRPDLIILDVTMPVMNGLQAAEKIREVSPATKIVILSMHESPYITEKALQAGADVFLSKSDAGGKLLRAVDQLFDSAPKM
jgi:DNA-binding NarL/FixJ family response regulator